MFGLRRGLRAGGLRYPVRASLLTPVPHSLSILPRLPITTHIPLRNYSTPKRDKPVFLVPSRRLVPPPDPDYGIAVDVRRALHSKDVSVQLRGVMRHMVHPVVILTTSTSPDPDDWRAMTISSFTSLSLDPHPLVTFNVKTPSACSSTIHSRGAFIIHAMLPTPRAADFATRFSQPYVPGQEWKYTVRPNSVEKMSHYDQDEIDMLLEEKDMTKEELAELRKAQTPRDPTVLAVGQFGRVPVLADKTTDNLPSLQEEVMFRLFCVPEETITVQDHEIWVARVVKIQYPQHPPVAYGIEPHAPLSLLYGDRSFREAGLHLVEQHNKFRRWVRRKMAYEQEQKDIKARKLQSRLRRVREAKELGERQELIYDRVEEYERLKRESKMKDREEDSEEAWGWEGWGEGSVDRSPVTNKVTGTQSKESQDGEGEDVTSALMWWKKVEPKIKPKIALRPLPPDIPPPAEEPMAYKPSRAGDITSAAEWRKKVEPKNKTEPEEPMAYKPSRAPLKRDEKPSSSSSPAQNIPEDQPASTQSPNRTKRGEETSNKPEEKSPSPTQNKPDEKSTTSFQFRIIEDEEAASTPPQTRTKRNRNTPAEDVAEMYPSDIRFSNIRNLLGLVTQQRQQELKPHLIPVPAPIPKTQPPSPKIKTRGEQRREKEAYEEGETVDVEVTRPEDPEEFVTWKKPGGTRELGRPFDSVGRPISSHPQRVSNEASRFGGRKLNPRISPAFRSQVSRTFSTTASTESPASSWVPPPWSSRASPSPQPLTRPTATITPRFTPSPSTSEKKSDLPTSSLASTSPRTSAPSGSTDFPTNSPLLPPLPSQASQSQSQPRTTTSTITRKKWGASLEKNGNIISASPISIPPPSANTESSSNSPVSSPLPFRTFSQSVATAAPIYRRAIPSPSTSEKKSDLPTSSSASIPPRASGPSANIESSSNTPSPVRTLQSVATAAPIYRRFIPSPSASEKKSDLPTSSPASIPPRTSGPSANIESSFNSPSPVRTLQSVATAAPIYRRFIPSPSTLEKKPDLPPSSPASTPPSTSAPSANIESPQRPQIEAIQSRSSATSTSTELPTSRITQSQAAAAPIFRRVIQTPSRLVEKSFTPTYAPTTTPSSTSVPSENTESTPRPDIAQYPMKSTGFRVKWGAYDAALKQETLAPPRDAIPPPSPTSSRTPFPVLLSTGPRVSRFQSGPYEDPNAPPESPPQSSRPSPPPSTLVGAVAYKPPQLDTAPPPVGIPRSSAARYAMEHKKSRLGRTPATPPPPPPPQKIKKKKKKEVVFEAELDIWDEPDIEWLDVEDLDAVLKNPSEPSSNRMWFEQVLARDTSRKGKAAAPVKDWLQQAAPVGAWKEKVTSKKKRKLGMERYNEERDVKEGRGGREPRASRGGREGEYGGESRGGREGGYGRESRGGGYGRESRGGGASSGGGASRGGGYGRESRGGGERRERW